MPEFFQRDREKRTGFRPDCKSCRLVIYATKKNLTPKLDNRKLSQHGLKKCSTCMEALPIDRFSVNSRNSDGLSGRCRECLRTERKQRREANKERFDASAKAYKLRNQEKVRERATRYAAKRRAEDAKFRFRGAVTRLVGHYLKRKGASKSGNPFFQAIGYTPEELRTHVERQFLKGMNWENYGDWHLDHVVPNASFDYTAMTDPDFQACWSLSNLRPLWGKENLSKADAHTHLL